MDRGSFGQLSTVSVSVEDPDGDVPLFGFVIPDASVETAMIAGELYRRNGAWKFRAVGVRVLLGPTPRGNGFRHIG